MSSYTERLTQAQGMYAMGLANVKNKPEPKGQKFPNGSTVRIADALSARFSGESSSLFFRAVVDNYKLYTETLP